MKIQPRIVSLAISNGLFVLLFVFACLLPTLPTTPAQAEGEGSVQAPLARAPEISHTTNVTVYIPSLSKPIPPTPTLAPSPTPTSLPANLPRPLLLSPASGSALNTFVPKLKWDMQVSPPYSSQYSGHCLAIAKSPNTPTDCQLGSRTDQSARIYEQVPWDRLEPNTTYRWRVGVQYRDDNNSLPYVIFWSDEWAFTTPAANAQQLPAVPALLAPADNITLARKDAKFSWVAVPGAVEYQFWIKENNSTNYVLALFTKLTQVNIQFVLPANVNAPFQWKVAARNEFGWSADSVVRNVTLIP